MPTRVSPIVLCLFLAAACSEPVDPTIRSKWSPGLLRQGLDPTRPLITTWHTKRDSDESNLCFGRVCATRPGWSTDLFLDPRLAQAGTAGKFRPRLDRANSGLKLRRARADFATTGRGVLIALIDTGLDWRHPDFIDSDGQTRVAWLLDQTLPPSGDYPQLEEIGQGRVVSATELQAALDGQSELAAHIGKDVIGHGTHVAGIAASDHPEYTGVAPGSRLVAVKAVDVSDVAFDEANVLAAMAFAQRAAQLENQPLVINLSLGTQMGAHDGTHPVELAIDHLSQQSDPPVVVAVAAGNEAELEIHVRGAVAQDGPSLDFDLWVPEAGAQADQVIDLDFWLDSLSRVRLGLKTPGGHTTARLDIPGKVQVLDTSTSDGQVVVSIAAEAHPINGLWQASIRLSGEAGRSLSTGTWTISFSGQSRRIDGWIGDTNLSGPSLPRFLSHEDPGCLVGPPATARHALAVGAYVHRTHWTDLSENPHQITWSVDTRAPFSSVGPTRDGQFKPDLLAPGVVVASSKSADSNPGRIESMFYAGGKASRVLPDGIHAVGSGTSMAAPFAAGMSALVLQLEPSISGREMRALLSVSALSDGHTTSALFSPAWGFGKLGPLPTMKNSQRQKAGEPDVGRSLCGLADTWLQPVADLSILAVAAPKDDQGVSLGAGLPVTIQATGADFTGPVVDAGDGTYLRRLTAPTSRGQTVALTCLLDDQPFDGRPRLRMAAGYDEADGSGLAGGAGNCAQTPPGFSLFGMGLLAIFGWRARQRKRP